MSAMSEMSRAIRTQFQGRTLEQIPTGELTEMQTIIAAYAWDLRAELERRERERSNGEEPAT